LQIAGLSHGYNQVIIRGNIHTGRSFAAFYFHNGQLIAADCVNRPQEFMLSKKIIAEKIAVNPTELADESIPVKEFL
jgi:3-phenylpropionate/trans-cinnamate dioxygenase ferredoxin reductase subunit